MPIVREIMDRRFPTVAPSASIAEAARLMNSDDVQMMPVCQDGRLCGVVTQSAVISAIISQSPNSQKQSVTTVMKNDLPKVSEGVEILDAAKMMADHGVLYMPVVQNGRLQGILTIEDLLRESPTLAIMVLSRYIARRQHARDVSAERPCVST